MLLVQVQPALGDTLEDAMDADADLDEALAQAQQENEELRRRNKELRHKEGAQEEDMRLEDMLEPTRYFPEALAQRVSDQEDSLPGSSAPQTTTRSSPFGTRPPPAAVQQRPTKAFQWEAPSTPADEQAVWILPYTHPAA